ncbi:MAG: hypothetical protein HGB32_07950 [Geobacteraceae bacterium]|nr:hypothetical protein [Geobacteraceae bacterium]NTW80064.1 hypothetical protein [Geobacteraceae bacterium]
MKKAALLGLLLVLTASIPAYADGIVRFQCDEEDSGTEIYIDGKFAGECPADVPVNAGTVQLRARKAVQDGYERIFTKQLRVVDGVAQRVEIVLSAPQMTSETRLKKETAEADKLVAAAEAGDVEAMKKLAQRYAAGSGVKKDPAKAQSWHNRAEAATAQKQLRAANSGDIKAMLDMAARYDAGQGVSKDHSMAQVWRERAETKSRENKTQEEAAKRAKELQAKAQAKQNKIDQFSFFGNTSKFVNGAGVDNNNITSILLTGVPIMTLGFATDLISAPTRTTEINKLKNEATVRPSTWGKPDSMIARASLQLEKKRSTAENPILVTAAK